MLKLRIKYDMNCGKLPLPALHYQKKKKNSLCVYKMNDFKEVKEGELSFFPRTDHIAESKSYK